MPKTAKGSDGAVGSLFSAIVRTIQYVGSSLISFVTSMPEETKLMGPRVQSISLGATPVSTAVDQRRKVKAMIRGNTSSKMTSSAVEEFPFVTRTPQQARLAVNLDKGFQAKKRTSSGAKKGKAGLKAKREFFSCLTFPAKPTDGRKYLYGFLLSENEQRPTVVAVPLNEHGYPKYDLIVI